MPAPEDAAIPATGDTADTPVPIGVRGDVNPLPEKILRPDATTVPQPKTEKEGLLRLFL